MDRAAGSGGRGTDPSAAGRVRRGAAGGAGGRGPAAGGAPFPGVAAGFGSADRPFRSCGERGGRARVPRPRQDQPPHAAQRRRGRPPARRVASERSGGRAPRLPSSRSVMLRGSGAVRPSMCDRTPRQPAVESHGRATSAGRPERAAGPAPAIAPDAVEAAESIEACHTSDTHLPAPTASSECPPSRRPRRPGSPSPSRRLPDERICFDGSREVPRRQAKCRGFASRPPIARLTDKSFVYRSIRVDRPATAGIVTE